MQQPANVSPEWINVALLQKAIRSYRNDDSIEIIDFSIKSGFSEHIASAMFQCKIDFKSFNSKCETLNVVVKARPITDGIKLIAAEGPLFVNEIKMYTNTIPAFHQLYERSGIKIDLAPELIYVTVDPCPIIILKDLTADGYFAPRIAFEELENSKLIVQRLAQFHAASYYLSEMNEVDFHNYAYTPFQNEALIYGLYNGSIKVFQEVLQTWDGYQHFVPKIETYMQQIGEIGRKENTPNKPNHGYNVLNHGDFHLRNSLIKLNSQKKLQQFCFIDYQLCIYGSPAIDINFLFGWLKRDENWNIPLEDVVVFYHQEFSAALNSLGFSKYIPSLIDLNVELIRHGRTNVLMQIAFIPFAFIDWETCRIEDMMGSSESDEKSRTFKKSLYNNPNCTALMQRTLRGFQHKGWL